MLIPTKGLCCSFAWSWGGRVLVEGTAVTYGFTFQVPSICKQVL